MSKLKFGVDGVVRIVVGYRGRENIPGVWDRYWLGASFG